MRFTSTSLILVLIVSLVLTGCSTCNPKGGGIGYIRTWDVPAGQTYTFLDPTENLNSVDFIARVFYSTFDTVNNTVGDGLHPLVIFGHGRFGPYPGSAYPNNYLHASYLMKQLASWGYICVTVNFDVVNSLGNGLSERGELFLKAIDFMLAQNNDPNSKFYQKIDVDRIGIIGHSRGGGGATSAVNRNQAQGSPRKIKALATISPTNLNVSPVSGMPQLMIYGTWDGDLSSAPGYKLWDPAPRDKTKIYVELYGANHFFFSDDLIYDQETNGIPRENHQNIAKGFINAFFDQQIRGYNRYSWPDYLTYLRKVDTVEYYVQYMNENKLIIDDGGIPGTPTVNNLGGDNIPTSLTLFDDINMGSGANQYGSTNGLRASWNAASDALAFNFASTNASTYDYISFRASQRHGEAGNTLNTFKNIKVRLTDNGGNSFTLPITNSTYKGLQYPDQAVYPGGPGGFKNIPSTFRLKLTAFTGVNLNNIVKVTLLFDAPNSAGYVNNTGAITIDDLEFTK
jgi:dienelactone hydrolase